MVRAVEVKLNLISEFKSVAEFKSISYIGLVSLKNTCRPPPTFQNLSMGSRDLLLNRNLFIDSVHNITVNNPSIFINIIQ